MSDLHIRNISDRAIGAFEWRARIRGTTSEGEICNLIEAHAEHAALEEPLLSSEEKLASALRCQARTPKTANTRSDVVAMLREDRDR